jgi:hypothetical protein
MWLPVFGQDHAQKTVNNSAEHHRVTPEPAVAPAFGSMMLGELYSLRWVSLRSTHPTNNK